MSYLLTEIFVYLFIAGLIGFLLGWTVKSGTIKENTLDNTKEKKISLNTTKTTNETTTPKLLSQARAEGKDNLSLLKGIGPVVEEKLNKLGIYHLDQVASWSAKEQAWIDEQILFPKKVEREEWVKQAKELLESS